jgi:hypothetical protein
VGRSLNFVHSRHFLDVPSRASSLTALELWPGDTLSTAASTACMGLLAAQSMWWQPCARTMLASPARCGCWRRRRPCGRGRPWRTGWGCAGLLLAHPGAPSLTQCVWEDRARSAGGPAASCGASATCVPFAGRAVTARGCPSCSSGPGCLVWRALCATPHVSPATAPMGPGALARGVEGVVQLLALVPSQAPEATCPLLQPN